MYLSSGFIVKQILVLVLYLLYNMKMLDVRLYQRVLLL